MIYTGTVATTEEDLYCERFSKECLEDMAKQAKGIPVVFHFDPNERIGEVEHAVVQDGMLYITFKADEGLDGLYVVPGYRKGKSKWDGESAVYEEVEVLAYSATDKPSDFNLIPLTSKIDT